PCNSISSNCWASPAPSACKNVTMKSGCSARSWKNRKPLPPQPPCEMFYPLTFQPIFQERIWGGRKLETLYGKPLPPGKIIGESWEISDRADANSVVTNGPLASRTLASLMASDRDAIMGRARSPEGRFPLLIKLLDAQDNLSLQVHPPQHLAAELGGCAKTEMWY